MLCASPPSSETPRTMGSQQGHHHVLQNTRRPRCPISKGPNGPAVTATAAGALMPRPLCPSPGPGWQEPPSPSPSYSIADGAPQATCPDEPEVHREPRQQVPDGPASPQSCSRTRVRLPRGHSGGAPGLLQQGVHREAGSGTAPACPSTSTREQAQVASKCASILGQPRCTATLENHCLELTKQPCCVSSPSWAVLPRPRHHGNNPAK